MNIASWKFVVFVGVILVIAYILFPRNKDLSEMLMGNFQYEDAKSYIERAHEKNPVDTRALRNLARYYEVMGKSKEQLEIYEKLVQLLPQNIEFRYQLAKLYRWNNKPGQELEQLEAIEKITPKDPQLLERLIDFYTWRKDDEKATEIMGQLIQAEPWNPDRYVKLSDNYIRLKKYDKAIQTYEALIQNYKKTELQYHMQLSDIYEWQKQNEKGVKLLLKGFSVKWGYQVSPPPRFKLPKKLDSEDWEALERLSVHYFHLKEYEKNRALYLSLMKYDPTKLYVREDYANFLWKIGEHKNAIQQFETLLTQDPKNLKYIDELADLCASINDLTSAENYYLRALEIDPNHAPSAIALAEVYIWKEEPERAIPVLISLPNQNNPEIKSTLANAYFYSGNHMQAIQLYQQLVELTSHKKDYERNLADAYLYSGQVAKATKLYLKLIQRYPKERIFHVRLGEAYISSGKFDSGIEILKEEFRHDPKNPDISSLLGSAYQGLGLTGEAERFYERTLELLSQSEKRQPQSQDHFTSLEQKRQRDLLKARTLLQLSSSLEGLEILERMYEKDNKRKEVYITYAYALMQHGQYEKALHILYPIAQDTPEPEVYRALGSLYDDVGNPYTSSQYYEKVLKAVPSDKNALLSLAFSYQNLHRPLDAQKISQKLRVDHPDWASVRKFEEDLQFSIAPKVSLSTYFSHLRTGEMTRYEHTHGEVQLTNRYRFLGDIRLGNYRSIGNKIDDHIATIDLGGNYFWNDFTNSTFAIQQFMGDPTYTLGIKTIQDFNFFKDKDYAATLTFNTSLHELWIAPIITIPHKGTQNILDISYVQDLIRKIIFFRISATAQRGNLENGIHSTERTFEGNVGVRILRSNPKLIVSYRYFRNSPTSSTRNSAPLKDIISLIPITQHHYITDLHFALPNHLTLFGSSTWSGHKDQNEVNMLKSQSLIGWTTGFYWPMTQSSQLTFNLGNSAAGSEGGTANKEAKVYYSQLEMSF